MVFLILVAVVILTILIYLIRGARENYGVLEALKIPVVKRSFFLGSTPDLHLKVQHLEDIERFKKYGPVYGVYEGKTPQVHVCSPDLIKQILVTDFESFQNRREVDLGNPLMNRMLDFIPVEPWRILRGMQTPTLTGSKIKRMSTRMEESVQEFVQYLEQKVDEAGGRLRIDARKTFVPIAIDMLANGFFGFRAENPCDYSNSFVQKFRELMNEGQPPDFMYTLAFSFPILRSMAPTIFPEPVKYFARIFRNVIKMRDNVPPENDYVGKLKEMMDKTTTDQFKAMGIDENTVLAQGIGPLLAGYDAIATTTVFLCYYMAANPGVQKKLQEEVDSYFERFGTDFKYENVCQLFYMNACIKETLRMVPPFIRPERICTRDWEYNGVKISKGCVVMVPAWAANRNPELYDNPDTFDPERFIHGRSINNQSYTFGDGPRNCIGTRFSYDALKISLVQIIRRYQFSLRSDTQVKFRPGALFLLQYEPIYLDMSRRSN